MTRAPEDLVGTSVALANERRAQMECLWPGAGKIFAAVDSLIAPAFPRSYPAPADARGPGQQRLAGFLDHYGYIGKRTPPRADLPALPVRDLDEDVGGAPEAVQADVVAVPRKSEGSETLACCLGS